MHAPQSPLFPYTTLFRSSPVVVNQASSCTATVSDTSPGTSITPTGRVNFTETGAAGSDRKSTRLNSSHLGISYAVFCLKKKTYIAALTFLRSTVLHNTNR